MFNLNDIIQNAQGGQAIGNLAQQFGLSPQQAQAAIGALLPGLSMGINNAAQSPAGMGGILGQLLNGANADAFQHPSATAAGAQSGGDILGQLFGGGNAMSQITQQASQVSGVSASTLQQMLPALVSMVMGGMFQSMNNQGMGGILGQLAGAVLRGGGGGLGGGLGGALGGGGQQAPAGGGGLGGGMGGLSDILGKVFGGSAAPQAAPAGLNPGSMSPGGATPGLQSQAIQMGLDTLSKMFQHGTQVQQQQQAGLQDIFAQMLGGKR